jgi:hypothetical protein
MNLMKSAAVLVLFTSAQSWANDHRIQMSVTHFTLAKGVLKSAELCSGAGQYDVLDETPHKLFNCKYSANQREIAIAGGGGFGLIRNAQASGQAIDQGVYVIYLILDGKSYQNWVGTNNLSPRPTELTWDLPAPEVLLSPGADSEWLRVKAKFEE